MNSIGLSGGQDMELADRLRQARERMGWSVEEVGAQLRLPARVIERVEAGDFDGLGAPIYRRGYLRSFARLVGVAEDEVATALAQDAGREPELVATGVQPRGQYMLDRVVRPASYIALTALIALPVVWWAASGRLGQELTAARSFDLQISAAELAADEPTEKPSEAPGTAELPQGTEMMRASLVALPLEGPPPAPVATLPQLAAPADLVAGAGPHEAVLELGGDSWVEVTDGRGRRVHQALMRPGQWRFRSDGPLAFTIGNSRTARLIANGEALELAEHRSTNDVVRIEVFSND
ncbi:MAG: helix-turn-helix domain-containing protein [Xanthomonadales bacterium]|nr:helix-turn-helix domain-containing protein [Xanthomonadales bacterium]